MHPLAGKPASENLLISIPQLVSSYYTTKPEIDDPANLVIFGTSGHRGSSLKGNFTESHILAIAQSICDYKKANKIDGPTFIGIDTHALSYPAFVTVMEVFTANGINILIQNEQYTPTPVISHAILTYNQQRQNGLADGVIITPSHNPPEDGGVKYNPTTGGPADTQTTRIIEDRANEILKNGLIEVRRFPYQQAKKSSYVHEYNYIQTYVNDLPQIINMDVISSSGLKIGVDPMGGSGVNFWEPIGEKYKLNLEIVNKKVDPTFSFMTVDKDGKIRMDCSSPYAMAGLINLKDKYDIAFGNDPDFDRHGIVTRSGGLMNPNHYLSVAVFYLFKNRLEWPKESAVGKTLVSSSMIDRVTNFLGRRLSEVPVGFKWFVDGLLNGSYGFGGEESAGASFLRKNGKVWTTDKDGIIMDLLAAEITAETGRDPAEHYLSLQEQFGSPIYERMDAPANVAQKEVLKNLSPDLIQAQDLAGEKILAKLTNAPGNNAPIGGLKVVTENGWFAARPSGTEEIYKIYAESFKSKDHLKRIQSEAQTIINMAFKTAGA
jgi:phosphoglucomutase